MSCMDDVGSHANGPGWFPVDIDKDRRPYLAENTFYYKNETRFFDPSRSGIHGQYFTCKITFISIPIEMYFWKRRKIWCCWNKWSLPSTTNARHGRFLGACKSYQQYTWWCRTDHSFSWFQNEPRKGFLPSYLQWIRPMRAVFKHTISHGFFIWG